jgi:peptidoglycan/LPS O-acetylase OafA/YrhL
MAGSQKSPRNGAVEFWRYIFAVFVVMYHFEKTYEMMPWMSSTRRVASVGFIGVEFFFILAGFLIAETDRRRVAQGAPDRMRFADAAAEGWGYAWARIKTIYPTLIAVLAIFTLALHSGGWAERLREIMNLEWELLLMGGTSFAWGNPEEPTLFLIVTWFITNLVITGFFVTLFLRMRRDVVRALAPFLAILLYSLFGLKGFELYRGHELYGFISSGMLRAAAGMFLGVTANIICHKLSAMRLGVAGRILLSLFEVYVIYRLVSLCWAREIGIENFRLLVYMPIIIILSFARKTAISWALNNPVSRFLGGISLTVYLFHWRFLEIFYTIVKPRLWAGDKGVKFISGLLGQATYQTRMLVNKPGFDMAMYVVCVTICSIALTYALKGISRLWRAWRRARTRDKLPVSP